MNCSVWLISSWIGENWMRSINAGFRISIDSLSFDMQSAKESLTLTRPLFAFECVRWCKRKCNTIRWLKQCIQCLHTTLNSIYSCIIRMWVAMQCTMHGFDFISFQLKRISPITWSLTRWILCNFSATVWPLACISLYSCACSKLLNPFL